MSFPPLIRDLLVDPALRLFLLLNALPQGLVWLLAVVLLALLSLRLFWFSPREPRTREKKRGAASEVSPVRELALLLRRASYSPWARRALRYRLASILVALRTEREPIPANQVWEELRSGRWPGENAMGRFLRGQDAQDFRASLKQALDELSRYAEGGKL
ncbi:MAG: hypothetical protein ACUVQS_00795 [Candidatus Bipolaricaulaceae bacterium]